MNEKTVEDLAGQIKSGLKFLHSRGVAHKDIHGIVVMVFIKV